MKNKEAQPSILLTTFCCLATLVIIGFICCFAEGCSKPEVRAGQANKSTHAETTKLATQVNTAETSLADADTEVVDVANDPRLPDDLKAKLADVQAKHKIAQAALKPIGKEIIPALDTAADKALKAELDAQSERNTKIAYTIAILVFVIVTIGMHSELPGLGGGFSWAISAIGGAVAALLLTVIVGEISKYVPWAVGIGLGGLALYIVESVYKGSGWAGLHNVWNTTQSEADKLITSAHERIDALENTVKQKAHSTAAAPVVPVPTAQPTT